MRTSVPTPAADDSAAPAPLRHLPGIITGIGLVTRHWPCVNHGKQKALLQCPNDWTKRTAGSGIFSLQGSSPLLIPAHLLD